MTAGGPSTSPGAAGEQGSLLSFAVPDDLLQAAVASSGAEEAVADLKLMPGVGQGKPPPILGIFRQYGFAPVTLLTLGAFVVAMLDSGLGVLAPDVQRSFHVSDSGLAAAFFAASAAQIAIGLPVALASDRGSRVKVAAVCLFIFAVSVPLQGLVTSIWLFALLGIMAKHRTRRRISPISPTIPHLRPERASRRTSGATSRWRERSGWRSSARSPRSGRRGGGRCRWRCWRSRSGWRSCG